MSQRMNYKGREVPLISESEYKQELSLNHYYTGLVLKDDGMLLFVNEQKQGWGITNSMGSLSVNTTIVVGAPSHTVVLEPELVKEAKRKLEPQWYAKGGQANWFYGLGSLAVENTPGTYRLTNGIRMGNNFSPRYYPSGWLGGTRAGIKTFNVAKLGKTLGKVSIGIGFTLDLFGVAIYYWGDRNSINAVHPAKAILNLGISVYGIYNPVVSVPYFFIDSFYPGGWNQALKDRNDLEERNQRIVPGFRLNPKEY